MTISSEIIETVIGEQTKFKGSVKTDKPIRIDGLFEGTINTSNAVVISETGIFRGTLKCREMQLYGKGFGNAFCSNTCQIFDCGYFEGDVTTRDIITVKGSMINGKIIIAR